MKNGITLVVSDDENLEKCIARYFEAFAKYRVNHSLIRIEDLRFYNFKLVENNLYKNIFLLNNHPQISSISRILTRLGYHVVNSGFLNQNLNKLDILHILSKNGISIPENYYYIGQDYPEELCMTHVLKSIRHGDNVIIPSDHKLPLSRKRRTSDYVEEYIRNECYKAYLANEKIFYPRNFDYDLKNELTKTLLNAIRLLNLELSSLDFFILDGDIKIMDINYSPGLMGSVEATNEFAKSIVVTQS